MLSLSTLTASFRQVMTAATVFSPVVAKLTRAVWRESRVSVPKWGLYQPAAFQRVTSTGRPLGLGVASTPNFRANGQGMGEQKKGPAAPTAENRPLSYLQHRHRPSLNPRCS